MNGKPLYCTNCGHHHATEWRGIVTIVDCDCDCSNYKTKENL